ncbi:putative fatty acyl-CoA reductase, partial [Stegodyphus mimosarum]
MRVTSNVSRLHVTSKIDLTSHIPELKPAVRYLRCDFPLDKQSRLNICLRCEQQNVYQSDIMAEKQISPVAKFYGDRSILITGATGFMGKVLVEKLLRSCSSIKTIYLLLRPKDGQEPKQRLDELLKAKNMRRVFPLLSQSIHSQASIEYSCNSNKAFCSHIDSLKAQVVCAKSGYWVRKYHEIFERVKNEQPSTISKLVAIHGDLTLPGLGISPSDVNLLISNVSIVFHSAATVKFDEPLKRSVDMNVLGTRRLVELCHKMTHLEALIHVSTAYCNCDREQVDEVVYPPPVPPQKIVDTIEWMDEDLVGVLTPHLIRGRPNTYTYTKALAETLLIEESGALPVAIVRPSIVTAAWKEPYPV